MPRKKKLLMKKTQGKKCPVAKKKSKNTVVIQLLIRYWFYMSLRVFVPVFVVFLLNIVIGLQPPKPHFLGKGKGVALAPLPHGGIGPTHL